MPVTGNQIAAEVSKFAGFPYVYGTQGPSTFDCSGLVQYVLTRLGVRNVPRTSEAQWAWVEQVPRSQLKPGDLVFAQFPGDNASPGHVGVYVGGGRVLSAEDPAHGVGFDTLADWGNAIVGYGRVPGSAASKGATQSAVTSSGGGLLSWPGDIVGFFTNADQYLGDLWRAMSAFFSPSTWVRAGAGGLGLVLFVAGLVFLVRAAS